jgi:hypothetical protein
MPSNRAGWRLGDAMKKSSIVHWIPWMRAIPYFLIALCGQCPAEPAKIDGGFHVKHVLADVVYLDGGSSAGLSEGQKLTIQRNSSNTEEPESIAEIEIDSVALISATAKIILSSTPVVPGDIARLTPAELDEIKVERLAKEIQKYAQVVSFTTGAPPDQEVRESLPKPQLPEVNRIRGRVAVDFSRLQVPGSTVESSQLGFMIRLNATRIGGSYWNINGYQRGQFQSSRSGMQQQTLTDLINRTYHLSFNYDNPGSRWVVGAGRLYIPWAASLNTLDGLYLGRRYGKETIGAFAGTNPDPTSWNYSSDRQTAGVFINTERGSFEAVRVTSTSGIAFSRIRWHPDRQFGFFENGIFYKRVLSIYSNVEADFRSTGQNLGSSEVVLSRSYLTIRLQPHKMISFDLNENYFRNIPTFDARLIGTGLLDKYLFQGLNGGFRLQLPRKLAFYSEIGRSSRTGDERSSWNYLNGASAGNILNSGIHIDYRYSRFDSSFGRGTYQSILAVREVGEGLRFEFQAGQQSVTSAYTAQNRARFVNGNADWFLGSHFLLGFGVTAYRGQIQRYNQIFINLGFRFDNRKIKDI